MAEAGKAAGVAPRKKSFFTILRPVRGKILTSMGLSALSALALIAALVVVALLLQSLITESSRFPFSLLLTLFALFAVYLYAAVKAADYSHFASYDLEKIIRVKVARKMIHLPMGRIVSEGTGALTKVLQDDVNNLHAYVADAPAVTIKALLTPLVTLIVLFYFNPRFALIFFLVLVFFIILVSLIMPGFREMMPNYNRAKEKMNEAIIEFVQAMPVIKLFDNGFSSFKRYKEALDEYTRVLFAWNEKSALAARYSSLIMNPFLTITIVIWAGLFLFYHNHLDFSVWILFLLLATTLIEAILPYMMLYSVVEQAKMSIARIFSLEDEPVLPEAGTPQTLDDYSIAFENVSFNYETAEGADDAAPVLRDINFFAPAQTLTAIVGSSGSGKSTLVRLIPRFWEVTEGAVKIGGVDIRDVTYQELMSKISFVFQDNFLFNDTIAANMSLGLENVSREDLVAAAKLAQAHEFIESLPLGYDTVVGERGAKISGGQKQRITIARAILQNRPILILDEATAHSDPENEALIMRAIQHLVRDKTVIMVAHRLAAVMGADQILVLDKGRLAESGRHADLVAAKGTYAHLWDAYLEARGWQYQNNKEK